MLTPPFLKPGNKVAIVSTARKISTEELQPFLNLLKSRNLIPVLGETIGAEDHQFAGNDKLRAQDFQKALDAEDIRAIWCARGGYGTIRMVDSLDFSNFKKKPKWIIGYSDVTVLHSHVHRLGIESLQANMAMEMDQKTEATRTSCFQVLFGKKYSLLYASEDKMNTKGKARGQLVGGNLSILYSMLGSPSAISTDGKILFIEDLDEYLYHIDRMMQNLKRNGLFRNLNGLVVGGMNDMNDNDIPYGKTAEEIIKETASEFDFPVAFGCPSGHIQDNRALIFGRTVSFEVKDKEVCLDFD